MNGRIYINYSRTTLGLCEEAKRSQSDHTRITTILGVKYVVTGMSWKLVEASSMFNPPLYDLTFELMELSPCHVQV